MVEQGYRPGMPNALRRTTPVRLGAPGPYVLAMVCATLGWLPMRIWEEWRGSWLRAVVEAGISGVIWGVFLLFTLNRWGRAPRAAERERAAAWRRTEAALRQGDPPADEAGRAALTDYLPGVRRGALLGAAVGAVELGGLAVLAVRTGWWGAAIGFGVVLVVVLGVAVRTLRRERRLRAALAPVRGG
ncbi:hypothetical protein O7607_04910 [Micromonospora sp. WMMA1949]|uniref:hypothetical protein n=1 Tax=Micromonospora sp. WMMA1949 TaxID=3015162 RepID=UPI0022B62294|nr:hypothetical protein [Micromonospora sp. WMMA1949]MCZ7425065.1 hypothetical protein [Micromonospora sp. WMMA1949]